MPMAPKAMIQTRWWMIAVAMVLVLILGALAVVLLQREDGKRRYQAQVAMEQAQGRVATVADYVSQSPPVDVSLQNAWAAWSSLCANGWVDPAYDRAAWDHWLVAGGEPPLAFVTTIRQRRAGFQPALVILRQGGLILSTRGWAAADLPPGRRSLMDISRVRMPNLLAVRDLATWLGYAAVVADDPGVHLDDLDALVTAMDRPGSVIDAMIALAIHAIRSRAYGDLALRDRLTDQRAAAWLSESPIALNLLADGIDGERALFLDASATWVEESTIFNLDLNPYINLSGQSGWSTRVDIWRTCLDDCTRIAQHNLHLTDRLRGRRPDPLPDTSSFQTKLGAYGRLHADWSHSGAVALNTDCGLRMARLAVRVLQLARQRGLPADQAALEAIVGTRDFRPPGDQLHLRYEALGKDRFRITFDPASPLPNFDDPRFRKKPTGTVASGPLRWESPWIIELPITRP